MIAMTVVIASAFSLSAPRRAWAADSATRDFITTCTYGAIAGGLVGAATLAFSEDPSKKVGNIARGASLGLYAGIAIGLYMIYGQNAMDEDAAAAAGLTQYRPVIKAPTFAFAPIVSERGLEGASAQYQILAF